MDFKYLTKGLSIARGPKFCIFSGIFCRLGVGEEIQGRVTIRYYLVAYRLLYRRYNNRGFIRYNAFLSSKYYLKPALYKVQWSSESQKNDLKRF